MVIFMVVCYTILACVALFMYAMGASIWTALSIFIYPTILFVVGIILELRLAKFREEREKEEEEEEEEEKARFASYQASINIIDLVTTNNDKPAFSLEGVEKLEEELEKIGHTLNCDISGYMD